MWIFNKYFVNVAEGIGFSDELPEDYFTESGFQTTPPAKNVEYFSFRPFFYFVGCVGYFLIDLHSCKQMLLLGSYWHSISKWTTKVQKQLFWSFFYIRRWLEFLLCHCHIAAISVRVFIRDIMHNIIDVRS